MYSIIFHISGIALLEICFYFYYIGPIESTMFQSNIEALIYDPISDQLNENTQYPIYKMVLNTTEYKNIDQVLIEQYQHGKLHRETQNQELFIYSIQAWCIFATFGGILYIISYKYKQYINSKHNDDDHNIEYDATIILYNTTRKNSNDINDNDIEDVITPIMIDTQNHTVRNKVIYYFTFGISVLLFEYAFFQYIVLFYNPLSIDELRYIVIQSLLDK
jgi:hypothetical protein